MPWDNLSPKVEGLSGGTPALVCLTSDRGLPRAGTEASQQEPRPSVAAPAWRTVPPRPAQRRNRATSRPRPTPDLGRSAGDAGSDASAARRSRAVDEAAKGVISGTKTSATLPGMLAIGREQAAGLRASRY